MAYGLMDLLGDRKLAAAINNYTLQAQLEDEFVERKKQEILADNNLVADLIADRWCSHPDRVGRTIALCATGAPAIAAAARLELQEMAEMLAETEALRLWHKGVR